MPGQELQDRVVVITGAASGVGRAAALAFASRGARIAVTDVDEAGAAHTVELIEARGGGAISIRTDVSSAAETQAMARTVLDQWGRIDVLYNNAAATVLCNQHDRPVHELDEANHRPLPTRKVANVETQQLVEYSHGSSTYHDNSNLCKRLG